MWTFAQFDLWAKYFTAMFSTIFDSINVAGVALSARQYLIISGLSFSSCLSDLWLYRFIICTTIWCGLVKHSRSTWHKVSLATKSSLIEMGNDNQLLGCLPGMPIGWQTYNYSVKSTQKSILTPYHYPPPQESPQHWLHVHPRKVTYCWNDRYIVDTTSAQ